MSEGLENNNDNVSQIPADLATDLLAKYGTEFNATKVDELGNLVNDEGTILAKIDDLLAREQSNDTLVKIEDKEYKLDKEGNALNEDGSIFKTKEELAIISDNNNLIKNIESKTNIKVYDENNNEVSFPDTPEGLIQRELAVSNQYFRIGQQESLNIFFRDNPEVLSAYLHLREFGNLNNFAQNVDYSKVTLDEKDIESHKQWIIKSQLNKGNSLEIAQNFANYAVDNKLSFKFATESINELKVADEARKQEAIKELNESRLANENAQKEYENKYSDIIKNKKEVKGLPILDIITVKDGDKILNYTRQDLIDYKFKPAYKDSEGNVYTKAEVDRSIFLKNIENELFLDYLLFTKQDFTTIINNKVADNKVKSLAERLIEFKAGIKNNNLSIPNHNNNNNSVSNINAD